MKILHLSTSDIDSGGAIAAYRLHHGLQISGVDSQMLVRAKFSLDRTVIADKSLLTKLGPPISGFPLRFYSKTDPAMFSSQWFLDAISPKVAQLNPDIIHLHWLCNGFLQIETLAKFKKPIVWTLHDMWPFTGGCHYARECTRYKNSCGSCPQLNSNRNWDLSHWIWQRKARTWKDLDLTIVSPSSWLAECARSSSLFKDLRIEVIPHGLDLEKYKPINQGLARQVLNLPQDKKLVLFGSSPGTTGDPRKGLDLLQPALQNLSQYEWKDKLELVVFGASQPSEPVDVGLRTNYLGSFRDDISLALVYSAVDIMVVPSRQEAFGQTASESLACGTPVVAFAATGLKDIIDHKKNGYLAEPFKVEDLARGINWILENNSRYEQLCTQAREKAEREFNIKLYASHYLSIYKSV